MSYNEDSADIERLLIKQQQSSLSAEEQAHLEQLIKDNPAAKASAEFYLRGPLQELKNDEEVHAIWLELEKKMLRRRMPVAKRWLAAASLLLLLTAGGYIALKQRPDKTAAIAAADNVILHLTGGKYINLTGQQTIVSGAARIPADKQSMDLNGINGAAKGWNTIDVPQKFDYKLRLSDGTEVTLNAATKLKFPFSFTGDKREVYVEGEAYFKVAQNVHQPFIVHTSKADITVLGTEFNVNTYTTDVLKTSLVNGSVNVSSNNQTVHLKPGEELTWNKNVHTISPLDERVTISWTQGVLYFHNTPLSEIAKMIERWYGIPVKIDDDKLAAEPFTGNMEKAQPLEDFLTPMKGIVKMRCYYAGNVLHMAR